jgi:UDP-glucose 4-epimerase
MIANDHASIIPPQKWLITGGCGFIGTNFIHRIIKDDPYHIRVIDNLSVGSKEALSEISEFEEINPSKLSQRGSAEADPLSKIELIVGDITDAQLAFDASAGADIIVHLAASTGVGPSVEDPRSDCNANIIGTLNYLEAARKSKIRRFILASSGAAIGECEPPIHEELAPHPVSPYGAGKLSGEAYCSAFFHSYGLETVSLRFGNVYGPRSNKKSSVVAKFIKQALAGQTLEIYGDGKQTRDFIFIDDLIRAIWQAATVEGIGGEIFQIATNKETTVEEVFEIIIRSLANYGINNVSVRHTNPRKGDVRRNFSDISKAKNLLKWETEVELDEGIERTVRWFI